MKIKFIPKYFLPFLIPYFILITTGTFFLCYSNDKDIFLFLNSFYHPWLDIFFKYYTLTGSGYFFLLIIVLFFFLDKKKAGILLVSWIIISLVILFLKYAVFEDVVRPYKYFEDIYSLHLVEGEYINKFNSFPSGHSTSAFGLACMLSLFFRNKILSFSFLLAAILTAYSRIYLVQHFFSDVFVGSLIGVAVSCMVWLIFEKRFKKFPIPLPPD